MNEVDKLIEGILDTPFQRPDPNKLPTDPVHEHGGEWWFWNETWSERIGPFDDKQQAYLEVYSYSERLNKGSP
jgi:hypothetical protein